MTGTTIANAPRAARLPLGSLLALFCAAFTAVMTELLPAGLLRGMAGELGVTEGRAGFLVSGYAAASFLAAIPLTAVLRGVRRRPLLVGVLLAFAACDAVTAASSSYALTFAARLLAGVTGGVMWAMLVGYAARMTPEERRGRAIAIVSAGITVALCAGIPAGAALAGALGWRAAFWTLAVAAAALAAWVRLRVPDFPGEAAGARLPLRGVATLPGIRTVLGVTVLALLGHQAVYTYLAPLVERTGWGEASPALLVFGVATVAGIWVVGAVVDRRPRGTLLAALGAVAAAMLALGTAAPGPAGGPLALAAVAVWGAAFGGVPTLLQTALVRASGPEGADVATSMQTTVYNLGIAAGSFTGGLVLEGAGAAALPWTGLPLAAAALAVAAVSRRHAFPARR
ncbi:MFS transporter [Nonomuraea pusilla]|uniref:Predicted arabinose efflux permease, MFS family n=1 Tax=Nonomuraea pusilla TaxID=46177 RepID=A0A1H7WY44_9ACTN|nr:MFS transporter [Nonomuraea pusilla]SEM26321.1 Predicted arabinose efflux permease, MFS family [Nonomuraea pusilla]